MAYSGRFGDIKRSLARKPYRGFHLSCEDFNPSQRVVVYGGSEPLPMGDGIEALSLSDLCGRLIAARGMGAQ